MTPIKPALAAAIAAAMSGPVLGTWSLASTLKARAVTRRLSSNDEPRALDYNLEFKSPEQQAALFAPDPYRASDHDPVIVALRMAAVPEPHPGDLNGDGNLNGRDVSRFVLALLFGRATLDGYDINGAVQ